MQKLLSSVKRVARYTARKLKDPDAISSDDYYYVNILYILATRSRRRSWLKGFSKQVWTELSSDVVALETFLTESVQLFIDALEGDIDSSDTSYSWNFLIGMLANYQEATHIQVSLKLIYSKKFPDMTLPAN